MKKSNVAIKFPQKIDWGSPCDYEIIMDNISLDQKIIFDLTQTKEITSSLIGFILDSKNKIDNAGGTLKLLLSRPVEKVFKMVHIFKYLQGN